MMLYYYIKQFCHHIAKLALIGKSQSIDDIAQICLKLIFYTKKVSSNITYFLQEIRILIKDCSNLTC